MMTLTPDAAAFHGGKVEIERSRVRARDGGEVTLPNWEAALSEDLVGTWALNLMLINVSTRKLGRAEPPRVLRRPFGLSHAAVANFDGRFNAPRIEVARVQRPPSNAAGLKLLCPGAAC